jgi:hypothetical protein
MLATQQTFREIGGALLGYEENHQPETNFGANGMQRSLIDWTERWS